MSEKKTKKATGTNFIYFDQKRYLCVLERLKKTLTKQLTKRLTESEYPIYCTPKSCINKMSIKVTVTWFWCSTILVYNKLIFFKQTCLITLNKDNLTLNSDYCLYIIYTFYSYIKKSFTEKPLLKYKITPILK